MKGRGSGDAMDFSDLNGPLPVQIPSSKVAPSMSLTSVGSPSGRGEFNALRPSGSYVQPMTSVSNTSVSGMTQSQSLSVWKTDSARSSVQSGANSRSMSSSSPLGRSSSSGPLGHSSSFVSSISKVLSGTYSSQTGRSSAIGFSFSDDIRRSVASGVTAANSTGRNSVMSSRSVKTTNTGTTMFAKETGRMTNAAVLAERRSVRCARRMVSNKAFVCLTTLLTIYALVGDDLRLITTNKPADVWFNVVTLVCIAVFTFEIIISCLGRDDYILGFFMVLDVISTVTLLLDLSWVSEVVMGDGEDLDKMRSGRTARVGAKAGRVVRVIRLVRILKLYKTVYEAANKRRQIAARAKKAQLGGDDDDWDDLETEGQEDKMKGLQESRVGKKLSEMTTRRVIILVLTMLMVLPFLRTTGADNYPLSPNYGADVVYEAWKERVERPNWSEGQDRYERAMLKYLYYHNWWSSRSGSCASSSSDDNYVCSSWYYSHVFWVGLTGTSGETLDRVNSTGLRLSSVKAWNQYAKEQKDIYNFGTMPDQTLPSIASEWSRCDESSKGIVRKGFSLLSKEIDGLLSYAAPCPSDLRNVEKSKFSPRLMTSAEYGDWHFTFYFDTRAFAKQEATFGIGITFFVCVVLCIASLYFSNDANKLVLHPVEQMIKRVESIRQNPLIAMKMADEEFKLELIKQAKRRQSNRVDDFKLNMKKSCKCGVSAQEEAMETVVLEKTIIKLGSLLALGFGEAGASIIGHNLACSDSAGVNVMIPGNKVECIIGKARINDFSTATEVLQANVMSFVNQIAEIVHGVVDEFQGAANKNNGDTFLLVWRTSGFDDATTAKFADMSMLAFAQILGAVHRSPVLAAYRMHPGLQQRLGTNCRVNLTFGLHAGWAIEGAVGSEFKIDASYLSPNVSIASSMEYSTKTYNVPILISQAVIEVAGDEMADKCRLIDRVIIRGSKEPMGLYSLDLDYLSLTVEAERHPSIKWNLRERFKARQFLAVEKDKKIQVAVKMVVEFDQTRDIALMRRRYTMDFLMMFHMGFQNYIAGEWQVAKRLLHQSQAMMPGLEDGPCNALLHFMEFPHAFQAPPAWNGIRDL